MPDKSAAFSCRTGQATVVGDTILSTRKKARGVEEQFRGFLDGSVPYSTHGPGPLLDDFSFFPSFPTLRIITIT